MSSLDPMAFVNVKVEDVCVKIEPADEVDTVNKTSTKSLKNQSNFCQTCFSHKNSNLKDMMQRYNYNGKYEVYSEMIDYCFLLQPRRNHTNNHFICELCILKLREVLDFRNQVEDVQINIKQNIELPSLCLTSHRDIEKNVEDEFEIIDNEISCLLNDSNTRDPFLAVDKETQSITDGILDDENEDSIGSTVITKKCDALFVDAKAEKYLTSNENRIPSIQSNNRTLDPHQLKCKMCGVTFDTDQDLQMHTLSHAPKLSCEICRRVFASREQLTEHGWRHQNEEFECLLCPGKRFKVRYKNVHMKRKHGIDNTIHRPAAVEKFVLDRTTKTNNNKNISTSLQECIISGVKSIQKLKNKRYTRNESLPYKLDSNQLQCKICFVEFESHQDLQKHMPSHFPNFTCETCGRVFANRKQMSSHRRLQHQNELIECPLCPEKRFKNRAYKSIHMKRFHGNDKKDFRCSYCNESFIKSEQRERHLILVHELAEMRFKCESCDATFSSNARRSDHFRRVHLNERKFVCEICSYSCFVKGGLEKHMLKHTGVRNFSCSVCQKKFLRKCTLDLHMPIHTGEKKHVCEICGKAFIQKCALNAHMQVHERRRLKGKGKI